MGSVMGTSIHAARLLLVEAEIARGCLGVDFRDFSSRIHKSFPCTFKRLRVVVAVGQVVGPGAHPIPQASLTISKLLRRRMEPTGQPTMHSGSLQWRQDVATRYLSRRSPSR